MERLVGEGLNSLKYMFYVIQMQEYLIYSAIVITTGRTPAAGTTP
ncbi:MAG: hypothetical protein ABI671_01925 [Burkholderiales bacterium]